MRIKKRAFFLVSLVIVVLSGFLLAVGISYHNAEIDNEIKEQEKVIDRITHENLRSSYDSYLFKIKFFIEENEQIRVV